MPVLLDTTEVAPHDAFDMWSTASSEIFYPMAVRRDVHDPFRGRVVGHRLGPVDAYRIVADGADVLRTPDLIALSDPERLDVAVQVRGASLVAQDGRQADDRAGGHRGVPELPAVPRARGRARRPCDRLAAAGAPRRARRPHVPPHRAALRGGRGARGGRRAVPREPARPARRGRRSGRPGPRRRRRRRRPRAVRGPHRPGRDADASRRPRCCSRASSATSSCISASAGWGRRPSRGRTTSRRATSTRSSRPRGPPSRSGFRHRRLERCRRDLLDPALRHESILSIATRWGLTSSAHFSRAYRARYAIAPSEERRRAI